MATINYLLQSTSNNAPIYLRLSLKRNAVYKRKTGLSINPKEWNKDKKQPKQTTAQNKNLTFDLRKLKDKIFDKVNEAQTKGEIINGTWLQYQIDLHFERIAENKKSEYVIDIIQSLIDNADLRKNSKGGIGLSKSRKDSYKSLKRIFTSFQKNKSYKVKEVNKKLADDFLRFMLTECNYSKSYATKKIADLKTVCFEAESEGIKVNSQLRKIKSLKVKNDFVIYLSELELINIKDLELSSEALQNARKWLLLGCNIGQRGGDLLNLTENNFITRNGYDVIELKQQKTGKNITIPVLPTTKEIIETGLPYKISIQKFNKYIKDICKLAEINAEVEGKLLDKESKRKKQGFYPKHKLITSHICRRSFATNNYGKLPTALIMQITGHSTEKMFLNYIGKDSLDFAQQIADYYALQSIKDKKEPQLKIVKNL
ncbi:phage integrase SAM-like domain-containing protein [Winogradskyella sp. MH6]|uniref:phage integrase SAM-like domain-containing protein n=1 Tax=Winogradskyella sp. MH6 TaxID=2929510 RepID=UPI001FB510F8|nr:phage integrase SAM-like domain-containing protein [Winogradskyella sp. MH6]